MTKNAASLRAVAEQCYEEIGGICVCQQSDVRHWCESCQRKINRIAEVILAFALGEVRA